MRMREKLYLLIYFDKLKYVIFHSICRCQHLMSVIFGSIKLRKQKYFQICKGLIHLWLALMVPGIADVKSVLHPSRCLCPSVCWQSVMKGAIDRIWAVASKPESGWKSAIKCFCTLCPGLRDWLSLNFFLRCHLNWRLMLLSAQCVTLGMLRLTRLPETLRLGDTSVFVERIIGKRNLRKWQPSLVSVILPRVDYWPPQYPVFVLIGEISGRKKPTELAIFFILGCVLQCIQK